MILKLAPKLNYVIYKMSDVTTCVITYSQIIFKYHMVSTVCVTA